MKKSEELKQQGNEEENDLKAMGLYNKALREKRSESFEEKWLAKVIEAPAVGNFIFLENAGKYTFYLKGFSTVDFFPKSNKLLVRSTNKWKKPGLKWLLNYLKLE